MLFVRFRCAVGSRSGWFLGVDRALSVFGSAVHVVSGVESALSRGLWIGSAVSLLESRDSGENATPSALPMRKPPPSALPMAVDPAQCTPDAPVARFWATRFFLAGRRAAGHGTGSHRP